MLDAQTQQKLKNDLGVAKNKIDFLKSLLSSVQDPKVDDVKKNDSIQEQVKTCNQIHQRFLKLIDTGSVQATEAIFSLVLQLNDEVTGTLKDYETLANGQSINRAGSFDYNPNDFKEKDPFAELAYRNKPIVAPTASVTTTTTATTTEDPFESLARRKKDEKVPTQSTAPQQNLDDFDILARRNTPVQQATNTQSSQPPPKTQQNTIDSLLE